jgi:hypothetical protein
MDSVEKCPVPSDAMLNKYSMEAVYVDCYRTEVRGQVAFPEFIFAFYTTPLFRVERVILQFTVSKPSTDLQARQLANGTTEKFAAWHVEDRSENELLMCDFRGRTRSWLMVVPVNTASAPRTCLYFGSAVVPVRNSKTGELSLGFTYQALIGFHKIYSILLLYSAKSNVTRQVSGTV